MRDDRRMPWCGVLCCSAWTVKNRHWWMYCHCQLQAAPVALMLQRRSSSSHWLPAMWMILSCVLTFTWSTHQWRLGRCVLRRDQYNLHALSFRLLWQFPWVQCCYWWVLTAYLTQGALLHPLFEVTIQARQPHTLCQASDFILAMPGWPSCGSSTTLLSNLEAQPLCFPLPDSHLQRSSGVSNSLDHFSH